MINLKVKLIAFSLGIFALPAFSQSVQTLTIDSCYAWAKSNYPLIKQTALIEQAAAFNIENASKGNLPQLSLNGQATYQSDVTALPISLPNLDIPSLNKDQYKIYLDFNQSLTNNLVIKQQKEVVKANAAVEAQKIEAELFQLNARVNNLYFGILMLDAQLELTDLLTKDIENGIQRTEAAIKNGIATINTINILKAESLKVEQRKIELVAARQGFIDMLGAFINQSIDANTTFEAPKSQSVSTSISRPELKIFDFQNQSIAAQTKLLSAKNLPHVNLFAQGGYGRPALNMLSNDFDLYYIGGLRLNWNLSNFYTLKKDKQLLSINQQAVALQKETFLFNTQQQLKQQSSEITKYETLLQSDESIINLRENIKQNANSQLENGTITTTDYLSFVNAANQSKQTLLLHQIQLLMAKYTYQSTSGN